MSSEPAYELFAIRYATNSVRTTKHAFLYNHDIHESALPLDFFVWAAVSGDRIILIDSGADEETCKTRGHEFLRCPSEGLRLIGLDPAKVTDVVVTHMHWDHVGNFDKFPNAKFHIHPLEMAHATGPCMCHPTMKRPYDVEQVCAMIKALYGGRVSFSGKDYTVAPSVSVHHTGGHTPGLQVVRVMTKRGWVVVASDALHYYANAIRGNPFPVLVDMAHYFQAHKTLMKLADSPDHVIAGHDPIILEAFPAVSNATRGIAVRLDVAPVKADMLWQLS